MKKFVVQLVQPFYPGLGQGIKKSPVSVLDPNVIFYILKCLIGLAAGYLLYRTFPQHQFYWSLISIMLVLAPDGSDSTKLAAERIGANLIGSITGVVIFMIHTPDLLSMGIGAIVTILLCAQLNLLGTVRASLAALLVIMIREQQGHRWQIGLERLGCVIIGCIIGLLVTAFFELLRRRYVRHLHHHGSGDTQ